MTTFTDTFIEHENLILKSIQLPLFPSNMKTRNAVVESIANMWTKVFGLDETLECINTLQKPHGVYHVNFRFRMSADLECVLLFMLDISYGAGLPKGQRYNYYKWALGITDGVQVEKSFPNTALGSGPALEEAVIRFREALIHDNCTVPSSIAMKFVD